MVRAAVAALAAGLKLALRLSLALREAAADAMLGNGGKVFGDDADQRGFVGALHLPLDEAVGVSAGGVGGEPQRFRRPEPEVTKPADPDLEAQFLVVDVGALETFFALVELGQTGLLGKRQSTERLRRFYVGPSLGSTAARVINATARTRRNDR